MIAKRYEALKEESNRLLMSLMAKRTNFATLRRSELIPNDAFDVDDPRSHLNKAGAMIFHLAFRLGARGLPSHDLSQLESLLLTQESRWLRLRLNTYAPKDDIYFDCHLGEGEDREEVERRFLSDFDLLHQILNEAIQES